MNKKLVRPDRLRRVPAQFSWVDHRLVRNGHLHHCTADAAALYLFLVTVADAEGLSYYGDARCLEHLSMDIARLQSARQRLLDIGLIAYERPFYQVLSLDPVASVFPSALPRSGKTCLIGEIIAEMGL